jgi:hypothetical protein
MVAALIMGGAYKPAPAFRQGSKRNLACKVAVLDLLRGTGRQFTKAWLPREGG